jgi:hypothetical protein
MLRQLRDDADLTLDQAVHLLRERGALAHHWSKSKLHRIETREAKRLRPAEIAQIAEVCGASEATRELLQDMADKANQRGWWLRYPLPGGAQSLVGLEQGALAVRQYESTLLPGLVQTSDYARALMRVGDPVPPEVVESRVAARMVRQQVLSGEDPLQLHVVLDEAALRRPVGTPRVVRGQLEHLLECRRANNITIQVIPFAAGAHGGMEGPFTVLTLPAPLREVGYFEGPPGCLYLEDEEHVNRLNRRFEQLSGVALDVAGSAALIERVLSDYV